MADSVWRVTIQAPNVHMYFWNQIKASRYASDRRLAPPVQVPRPDGQPVN